MQKRKTGNNLWVYDKHKALKTDRNRRVNCLYVKFDTSTRAFETTYFLTLLFVPMDFTPQKATDEGVKENLRRLIATHSPMSWAHINMLGEYDFSDEKLRDSIGILPLKSAA